MEEEYEIHEHFEQLNRHNGWALRETIYCKARHHGNIIDVAGNAFADIEIQYDDDGMEIWENGDSKVEIHLEGKPMESGWEHYEGNKKIKE